MRRDKAFGDFAELGELLNSNADGSGNPEPASNWSLETRWSRRLRLRRSAKAAPRHCRLASTQPTVR
jgi:hypothetical protein